MTRKAFENYRRQHTHGHKHFMCVSYSGGKVRLAILENTACQATFMQCKSGITYFVRGVSYSHDMFFKFTTVRTPDDVGVVFFAGRG
jgi:hypothetical protein